MRFRMVCRLSSCDAASPSGGTAKVVRFSCTRVGVFVYFAQISVDNWRKMVNVVPGLVD